MFGKTRFVKCKDAEWRERNLNDISAGSEDSQAKIKKMVKALHAVLV